MGRNTIANQIHASVVDKISYGESKHIDKLEQEKKFGGSTYKIYSFDTYDTYRKVGKEYARWFADKVVKYGKLADAERSALHMIYGHGFDSFINVRHSKDVTISRLETANDKRISRMGKYKDIFTMFTATGCLRCNATRLTVISLVEK